MERTRQWSFHTHPECVAYIYSINYFQPFSFSYFTFVFHHTLRDILGHTKTTRSQPLLPTPKKKTSTPKSNSSSWTLFFLKISLSLDMYTGCCCKIQRSSWNSYFGGFLCLGKLWARKPFSGRTWGVVLKVQQFLFDVNVCLHLEIRHTIQGIVEETWMCSRGEWRWNGHKNGNCWSGGQQENIRIRFLTCPNPCPAHPHLYLLKLGQVHDGKTAHAPYHHKLVSHGLWYCRSSLEVQPWENHSKWPPQSVMSCYVMLCFTLLTSQCSPNRLNPAHPLRLLHLRAISTPRHLQGLKGTTKWPPKSDLREIRFQKQNRKKHPKYMDLNDLFWLLHAWIFQTSTSSSGRHIQGSNVFHFNVLAQLS